MQNYDCTEDPEYRAWKGLPPLKEVVRGDFVFSLKTTHGLPLEMIIDWTIGEMGLRISWVDFIKEARKNKWFDFQIYETINYALQESMIDTKIKEAIKNGVVVYLVSDILKPQ